MSENGVESASAISNTRSFLNKAHDFIDTHPRTIHYGAYSLGVAGVVLILRSVHVGKFIKNVNEVPKRFITKGVHLQGNVKEIHSDGKIYVLHQPLLDLRLPWNRSPRRDYLPMTLAFVDLTDQSRVWLKENLLHKNVWIQVLKIEEENSYLPVGQAAIFQQKFVLWKTCVNEKFIEDGLCKISQVPEHEIKSLTKKQTELLDKMISLEKIADKKGRGLWKEEKPPILQTVKKYLYLPVIMSKFLYEKTKKRLNRS